MRRRKPMHERRPSGPMRGCRPSGEPWPASWRRISALFAAALLALFPGCGGEPAGREFLSIGTGGTGGIYYPLGGALASSLSTGDPHRTYTAEVSGGSVENVNRVAGGEVDLGFAISTTVRAAYRGEGLYEEPLTGLRIAAPLYPNLAHVLVRGGLAADDLSDLRGRPVSVGSAGSGTEQFSRHLLAAHGLDYETVDERYLSFTESSNALRDGAIDAAVFSVGYPASAVLEAVTQGGVRLLPVPDEALERLRQEHPHYRRALLPSGAYPGLDQDLPTVAMMNWVVATEELDDEVVTALLDVLREQRDALIRVNEIARQIDLEALRDAPIPLHPATAAWLERR